MKKILKEFREFAIQGNMIDMAVGMIIGAAFKDLVNSLVSDMVISLNGEHYATLAEAQAAAAPTVNYGLFITEIINFVIMAFVIFMVVKQLNRAKKMFDKPAAPAAATEKECPYCKTKINIHATRCPHCTSVLEDQ